jgi:hypothetical protein
MDQPQQQQQQQCNQ